MGFLRFPIWVGAPLGGPAKPKTGAPYGLGRSKPDLVNPG